MQFLNHQKIIIQTIGFFLQTNECTYQKEAEILFHKNEKNITTSRLTINEPSFEIARTVIANLIASSLISSSIGCKGLELINVVKAKIQAVLTSGTGPLNKQHKLSSTFLE